jgi:hypothetical protein
MTETMTPGEVLAVLERMRKQAMLGRLPDDQISSQELIRLTDEDRVATTAVAALAACRGL